METGNFITDCFQLNKVISSYQKYAAPPFGNVNSNIMPVIWNLVPNTSTPLLAYPLPWNGAVYPSIDFLSCISRSIQNPQSGPTIEQLARPDYNTESSVCVCVNEVFNNFPTLVYDNIICPNNETGVFDENSVSISTTSTGFSSYKITSISPLNMNQHYLPNWKSNIIPYLKCQTLSAIYFATIIVLRLNVACSMSNSFIDVWLLQ